MVQSCTLSRREKTDVKHHEDVTRSETGGFRLQFVVVGVLKQLLCGAERGEKGLSLRGGATLCTLWQYPVENSESECEMKRQNRYLWLHAQAMEQLRPSAPCTVMLTGE